MLSVVCSVLAEWFSSLPPSLVRPAFETLALAGCGLFVGELVRNRRLSMQTQARLQALVETSPAAIVTVDVSGTIELANRAAFELLAPRTGRLTGNPIAAFLPELYHAIRWEEAPNSAPPCSAWAIAETAISFSANVWFSTYKQG